MNSANTRSLQRLLRRAPVLSVALCSGTAFAQTVPFKSPGLPITGPIGQTTRFNNDFNPAIGVVLDGVFDYLDSKGGQDGFDFFLRHLELNIASQIDPSAWAYAVVVSENLETPIVEEAAVQFTSLAPRTDLRVGRFFLDFGKQMQLHPEDLRSLERPLVLRQYLGEELGGTGVRINHWLPLNDSTPLRASFGVYESLLSEPEAEDGSVPVAATGDRQKLGDLSFSARVTAMTEIGSAGIFQGGVSARRVSNFTFTEQNSGLSSAGLANTVWGLDMTYSQSDATGLKRFTTGLEWLFSSGDLAAQFDDSGTPLDPLDDTLSVVNGTVGGFYAFAEYGWNAFNSGGVQYSQAESLADAGVSAQELDFYYSRLLTEFNRLRLGVILADDDLAGESSRVYVQFTAFLGTHAHGLNW